MRGRTVCWTHSSVWPITSTPQPSTSHGPRMTWRSQRGCPTYATATTVTGHSTEFQLWVLLLEKETFTPARWSIKPRHSLSQRAGVRQAGLVFCVISRRGKEESVFIQIYKCVSAAPPSGCSSLYFFVSGGLWCPSSLEVRERLWLKRLKGRCFVDPSIEPTSICLASSSSDFLVCSHRAKEGNGYQRVLSLECKHISY